MSKDTFYSLVPINWLLRSTGLSNIYRKGTHLTISASIIKSTLYVIVFAFLNITCMYYKTRNFRGNIHTGIIRFSDAIQLTYLLAYFVYIIDVCVVCKYDQSKMLRYFKTFNHIDSIVGLPHYDKIRRTIIDSAVLSIAVSICVCFFDYVCWVLADGWKNPTIYAVDYIYLFLNLLTILDVVSHVLQIEFRLKIIGDLLQQKISTLSVIKSFTDFKDSVSFITHNIRKKKPLVLSMCTTWIYRSYLLLLEQVAYINDSFGLRVLSHFINILFNMVNLLNLAFRVVNGTITQTEKDVIIGSSSALLTILLTVCSILRAFNYEFVVIILMYRCEQAYKQSERILEAIDALLPAINKHCNGLKADLLEFRNLLITRPIKFHAAKFFTMDYTLLVSLNSVVVTYSIIMLQNMQ